MSPLHEPSCPGWYQLVPKELCTCKNQEGLLFMEGNMRNAIDRETQGKTEKARDRHGSPLFYSLLSEMADTHDRKSHDYASNSNPFGNYHFAGKLALLFPHSPEDAGFVGRMGEKIFRLANLEEDGKKPQNESIEDTERDIAVIATLWMADRRHRRWDRQSEEAKQYLAGGSAGGGKTTAMAEQARNAKSEAAASQIIELIQGLVPEHIKQMRDYLSAVMSQAEAMAIATKMVEKEAPLGHIAGQSLPRKSE